jgi:hypothetical protein
MILRPLKDVSDISEFTIKLVKILIKNHNCTNKTYINKVKLLIQFRKSIYFHPDKELVTYYYTCLRLMLINVDDATQFTINNDTIISI